MSNILFLGSCRLQGIGRRMKKNNIIIFPDEVIKFIHNHNEFTNIINNLKNSNYDNSVISSYSKIQSFDEDKINSILEQIDLSDVIVLELCSKKIYYEQEYNKYNICSEFYKYLTSCKGNYDNCDFVMFRNTQQKRDNKVYQYFIRKDNIILKNKDLYNFIILNNTLDNTNFIELNFNEENQNTLIKLVDMPNKCFETFSIQFDFDYMKTVSYSIKLYISCDSNTNIYIKYYTGTEYIYTNQKINDDYIIIENFDTKYLIGFYIKNDENKETNYIDKINVSNWNINFNIQSFKIIINDLVKIDTALPKNVSYQIEPENEFINNFNSFLNKIDNKKVVVVPNLTIKDNNNEEIICKKVNDSRLKEITFLKENISKIPNCYFFENYVTNDLISNQNHLNELGFKTIIERLEIFLKNI